MKCPKCQSEDVVLVDNGRGISCDNCGEIIQNHGSKEFIRVEVKVIFEIPINECDKQSVLWTDKTKFVQEVIGYGIFSNAKQNHVQSQFLFECEMNQAIADGDKEKEKEFKQMVEREKKYVDMLRYSNREYKILSQPVDA